MPFNTVIVRGTWRGKEAKVTFTRRGKSGWDAAVHVKGMGETQWHLPKSKKPCMTVATQLIDNLQDLLRESAKKKPGEVFISNSRPPRASIKIHRPEKP